MQRIWIEGGQGGGGQKEDATESQASKQSGCRPSHFIFRREASCEDYTIRTYMYDINDIFFTLDICTIFTMSEH